MTLSVDWCQIPPELELITENTGILWHVWMKIFGAFGEAPLGWSAKGVHVLEIEMAIISITLVFHQIDIDVDPIGAHQCDTALQLFPGSIASRDRAFLVLVAQ